MRKEFSLFGQLIGFICVKVFLLFFRLLHATHPEKQTNSVLKISLVLFNSFTYTVCSLTCTNPHNHLRELWPEKGCFVPFGLRRSSVRLWLTWHGSCVGHWCGDAKSWQCLRAYKVLASSPPIVRVIKRDVLLTSGNFWLWRFAAVFSNTQKSRSY